MEDRKKDHIQLAFEARVDKIMADNRFMYEPLLAAHPNVPNSPINFLGKEMKNPFWISSMTGGTQKAGFINKNLAKVAGEFGLGMGLGSCRALLDSDKHLNDFSVRSHIGDESPFYSNLGIAQVEELVAKNETEKIDLLNKKLHTDGTIIHINPLQEAFQPEGDRITKPPIDTVQAVLEQVNSPIVVKEVGQGMGYESLKALLKLNIKAIEFGALGGTNFTKLEQMRQQNNISLFESFANIGHTAQDMVSMVNQIVEETDVKCKQVIISGGIKSVLDGFYLHKTCKLPSVIGMGSVFLKYSLKEYDVLREMVKNMVNAWLLADKYLKIRS